MGGKWSSKDVHFWDNLSARVCHLGQLVIYSQYQPNGAFLEVPANMMDRNGNLKCGRITCTDSTSEDLSYWNDYSFDVSIRTSSYLHQYSLKHPACFLQY